jgi:hypothetical protein
MDSLEALDAAVARHLACSVVAHLLRLGLFDSLAKGAPTGELAAACEVEPAAFEAAIGFAVRFSGLLKTEGEDRVRFSDFLMGSDTARFRLLKYLGAYQPCVMSLGEAAPADGLLAMAYRQLSRRSPVGLVSYLMELKPRTVLEIGCGSAPVLRALASQDPRVSGLAVDPDASMVALARELVQTQRLSERVAIAEGSLSDVAEHCPQGWPPFDVLVLRSVLNEASPPASLRGSRRPTTGHGSSFVNISVNSARPSAEKEVRSRPSATIWFRFSPGKVCRRRSWRAGTKSTPPLVSGVTPGESIRA